MTPSFAGRFRPIAAAIAFGIAGVLFMISNFIVHDRVDNALAVQRDVTAQVSFVSDIKGEASHSYRIAQLSYPDFNGIPRISDKIRVTDDFILNQHVKITVGQDGQLWVPNSYGPNSLDPAAELSGNLLTLCAFLSLLAGLVVFGLIYGLGWIFSRWRRKHSKAGSV